MGRPLVGAGVACGGQEREQEEGSVRHRRRTYHAPTLACGAAWR
jgi:hypothetical protein